jgi:hypothetical protein
MRSFVVLAITIAFVLLSGVGHAAPPRVVNGVSRRAAPRTLAGNVSRSGLRAPLSTALAPRDAISSSFISFDCPQLFTDTLPLQLFHSLQSGAFFIGTGSVLDVTSFRVKGTTSKSAMAFNGRYAVNGDGTVPQLPEGILFLPLRQSVSLDVGSRDDAGRSVMLVAYDFFLNVLDSDQVLLTPRMQTLTVSSASQNILLVGLFGEVEAKILVVDNLAHN